jgi:signal transduction histidine kinase
MRATGFRRLNRLDAAWAAFALANVAAMVYWPRWETVPFHFIWVSLTLLYGFRVWPRLPTAIVLFCVCATSAGLILQDVRDGTQVTGELTEVPLMSAMFLAMVWHARRRQQAVRTAEAIAENRARLVEHQERFLHDVSHELRTPVTIARGHLELLRGDHAAPELNVALDELARIDRIINRLLLLAKAERPDFLAATAIDVETFVEDVFLRWSDVTPRVWRLGSVARGWLEADEEALRTALDALLENAVKHTDPTQSVELRARAAGRTLVLEVEDGGAGIPPDAREKIFDRFARVDNARNRAIGGVGLGLAIVDAVARAHGGSCAVVARERGACFALQIPGFEGDRHTFADVSTEALTAGNGRVPHS